MIETKNDMQLVGERLLADEWQTTATPDPEIVAHLFGLYGKMMKETKRIEAPKATSDKETAVSLKSFSSFKSLLSLRSLEGGSNG